MKLCIDLLEIDKDCEGENKSTPLFYALANNQLDAVKYLCETAKVNLQATDTFGSSVMHFAVLSDNSKLIDYLVTEQQFPCDLTDLDGRNSLHHAAGWKQS